MTKSQYIPKLTKTFLTKSGKNITFGTGTGTKWQWLKKGRSDDQQKELHQELVDQLLMVLQNGYNHIDTAEIYTTHPEVAAAVKSSGIPRQDLWIATKYNPGFGTMKATSKTAGEFIDRALTELETDYIDLLLIHSPFFSGDISYNQTIESAWRDLVQAKKDGKVRHIGVSNFARAHLEQTFKISAESDYPEVNQIEFHPYLQNQTTDIVKYCQDHNILVQAFGPLTPLFRINKEGQEAVEHPLPEVLKELAAKYNKTDAQILLRYTLQKGIMPITTSSKPQRVKESLEVYGFELEDEDVEKINKVGSTFFFRGFFDDWYREGGFGPQ
jgi:2-dehydropantolactone reductase